MGGIGPFLAQVRRSDAEHQKLTGRSRSLAEWAMDHAAAFGAHSR
jgi:hypothetical protein